MRLPVEWIREYVAVGADAEALAERLTMAGLEVEETEASAAGAVLNVKVTPNRGDCLSVVGIARELSALYTLPLTSPEAPPSSPDLPPVPVDIEAPEDCPRYAARLVRGVRPVESPGWMRRRLLAAGMRPIGAIVDATNYVMLEMGQPLHAFDFDRLRGGRIVVRRARPGERLTTLDGVQREPGPEQLLICDAERPVAVAGVMGGAETEIGVHTQTMLLESAHFSRLSVRRTARALGLHTEASYRFERTVDPEGVVAAADRACALIEQIGAGTPDPGVTDVYPVRHAPRALSVRPERVSAMLGFRVSGARVAETLRRLGFAVEEPSRMVVVPSWRPDVQREIDLVEEVGRVVGYDEVPEQLPAGGTTQGGDSAWGRFADRLRDVLAGVGLQEIVSHSLLAPTPLEDPRTDGQRLSVRSALSAELSGLRRSLLPGLVEAAAHNARRGQGPLALFEVGAVFHRGEACYEERPHVAALLSGPTAPPAWQREARQSSADFYMAAGLVQHLAQQLGVDEVALEPGDDPRLHPGRRASALLGGQALGWVGELHPDARADAGLREPTVVFELDAEALMAASDRRGPRRALSPYQAVSRDLAPRVATDLPFARVRAAVEPALSEVVEWWGLTDLFEGTPLPEGTRSLTLSFRLRAPDRTLSEAEVLEQMGRLREALERSCGATFAA